MVRKNKIQMFVLANYLIMSFIVFASCNTAEPPVPPVNTNLSLVQDEISCIEVWLKLTTQNLQLPTNLNLLQDNNIKKTISLTSQDTVLYIDSLLPNKTYQFQLVTNNIDTKSNKVAVTTLDTTDHNFTWQTFTFGQHSNSVLNDVAIISENDIWAVGEIYMNDSLGIPDQNAYNAVHWDGLEWKLKRIMFYSFCPQATGEGSYPASSIYVLDAENIVISCGSQLAYLKNGVQINRECVPVSADKIWGRTLNDFYIVGYGGGIAHSNGSNWTKIESGTIDNLLDVVGTTDGNTVWTCGYSGDYANTVLITVKDGVAEKVYEGSSNGQSNGYYIGPISGVWTDNDYRVFMMNAGGIYIQKNSNEFFLEKEVARFTHGSYGIDGTGSNNIFACGDRFVGHWNGSTYNEYSELYRQFGTYYNVSANDNIVCAAGTDYSDGLNFKAIIVLGHK
ncbi:MAG: glucosyl transferase [Ignavibacteriales bacterium]|nr:glucosyl transferase [Ignavibacteriales bacterium]